MSYFLSTASSTRAARRSPPRPASSSLEALESRIAPAVLTWTGGGGDSLWSTASNWSGQETPSSADDILVFPAGAARLSSVNDFASGTTFAEIVLTGSRFTLLGNSVNLSTGLTDSSSSDANTIAFDIGGAGGVTKSGASKLTFFGGANTFTGTSTVTGGTLVLGNVGGNAISGNLIIGNALGAGTVQLVRSNQIADTASVTLSGADAALDLAGYDDTIGALTLTGGTVATDTGTLRLSGNVTTNSAPTTAVISGNLDLGGATRTFTVADNALLDPDLHISANISGTGAGIIKAGANSQLRLSGSNTYDGVTTLNTGVIEVSSANALGSTAGGTVVASGTSLILFDSTALAAEPITVSGVGFGGLGAIWSANGSNSIAGDITLATDSRIAVSANSTLTLSGAIGEAGGTRSLSNAGVASGGTLVFSGTAANSYSGTTTLAAGTLVLDKTDGVTAIAGSLIIGDDSGSDQLRLDSDQQIADAASVSLREGATFDLNGHSETVASLTLQGSAVSIGAGGTLVASSLTTVGAANDQTAVIMGGTLDLNGASAFPIAVADDPSANIDLRISSVISNGGISKSGSGILALAGANTYVDATLVTAGAVQVESDAALGANVGGTVVYSGASVFFSGSALAVGEKFSISGSGFSSSGALATLDGSATLTGAITLASGSQVGASFGSTLTIDGTITDLASVFGLTVLQAGNGRTVLGGANAFDGGVTVQSGYLRLTNSDALGTGSASFANASSLELAGGITLPASASLTLSLNGVDNIEPKLINVSGDNTIAGPVIFAGNEEIATAGGTTLTITGAISETGSDRLLVKNGPGTLVLSGTSSYTGATLIGDGTLVVNGDISASNVVISDGIVGGTGALPAVTVTNIGSLAPGTSPGSLATRDLSLSAGATFSAELNGTIAGAQYDRVNTSGTVSLGGATFSLSLGFTPANGDTFVLISNDGTDAVSGTFSGLAEGATFQLGALLFRISYAAGDGNDVALAAILPIAVSVAASDAAAAEPGDHGRFTISLSSASAQPTTVAYSIGGSATAGSDYAALSGSVVIPANTLSVDLDLAVLDDAALEASEDVVLTLGSVSTTDPVVSIDAAHATVTVTIADDADTATVSVAGPGLSVAEGSQHGVFIVSLSTVSGTDTVVAYSVAGTATAGSDYTALSGSVTIPANTLSASIDLALIDDSVVEKGESFSLVLDGITSGDSRISLHPNYGQRSAGHGHRRRRLGIRHHRSRPPDRGDPGRRCGEGARCCGEQNAARALRDHGQPAHPRR